MSFSQQKLDVHSFRQAGRSTIAITLGVILTLTLLRLFPKQLLPAAVMVNEPVSNQSVSSQAVNNQGTQPIALSEGPSNFVAMAINQVGPAVVQIDTERTVATNVPSPFFEDPFFRGFFGNDMLPQLPREYQERGEGSGFIVDRSGIILTNAHVVSGADKVSVTLRDGRTFEGEVKGTDEPSDLAVIKIEGDDLPVAPLGDSDQLQVGDWAIALGNPLGLDNTVTLGIISSVNRSSSQAGIPDKRLDFIQTDAAINPGNSGGPLLNAKGEVIGINTAIRADAQGIGFAIPVNTAKTIKDALAQGEKISHPYIGIQMLTLTPEVAQQFNNDPNAGRIVPDVDGVLVMRVLPSSPAAEGGLRRGDVVVEIDGETITEAEQLQDLVEASQINQALRFKVRRNEQIQELTIRPQELQDAT
ncbi:MAG: HhoA/HhoB/HtrA family serine endopeptidase [Cyanobacteria bacterium J06634_5]